MTWSLVAVDIIGPDNSVTHWNAYAFHTGEGELENDGELVNKQKMADKIIHPKGTHFKTVPVCESLLKESLFINPIFL